MAEYVELVIDQGSDFNTTISINDDNTNASQNLSGFVVTSSLKRSLLSPNAYANFVCTIVDPGRGEIELFMSAANTANLRPGSYFFDVKVNDTGNNTKSRLIEGRLVVTPSVTV